MRCEGFDLECPNDEAVQCFVRGAAVNRGKLHHVKLCTECRKRLAAAPGTFVHTEEEAFGPAKEELATQADAPASPATLTYEEPDPFGELAVGEPVPESGAHDGDGGEGGTA